MEETNRMNNIIIVDYGMGNLRSIQKRFEKDGKEVYVSNKPIEIEKADKLILPGVGHFANAVKNIKAMNLWDILNYKALEQKTPVLGICLGLQLMTKSSEEGNALGFGWFNADVKRFQVQDRLRYKVPHIGWNDVLVKRNNPLFFGIEGIKKYYFVHSFHPVTYNDDEVLSITDYEYPFVSSLWRDNIFGVQFHPEKSREQGDILLRNFYNL
jgi:glutamine amidotransferase